MQQAEDIHLTILIPYIFSYLEVKTLIKKIEKMKNDIILEFSLNKEDIHFEIGVILSTPRSCLQAEIIAKIPEITVVCVDTDSLTQLTYGFHEDNAPSFLVRT
jgi:phosphoenolpyruvate-protein kinase (PTS system EI component)